MDHLVTSTPTVGRTSPKLDFEDASIVTDPKVKPKAVNLALILEAIEAVGVKRKGASLQAIKKYIEGTLSQSLDTRIAASIRRNLLKGLENGQLIRPSASQNATGCNGHFMISPTSGVKKKNPSSPKEQVSDSEAIPKPKKTKNINLSDTAIQDIKSKKKLTMTKMLKSKKKDEKENVKPTASKTDKKPKATKLNSEADSGNKNTAKTKPTNEKAKKNEFKPESEGEELGTEETKTVKKRSGTKSRKETVEDKTAAKPDKESAKDAVAKTRKGKTEDKPVQSNTEEVKSTRGRGRVAKNNIDGAKPKKGEMNSEEGMKPKRKEQLITKPKPNKNKVGKKAENMIATDEDETAEELDEAVFHEEEIEGSNDDGTDLPKTFNYAQDPDDKFGSDSEFVVKKPNRKSLKSHSSDTELEFVPKTKKGRNAKSTKGSKKNLDLETTTTGKGKKLIKADVKDSDLKNTRAKRSKK